MEGLLFLFGLFLALGLFFLAASLLHLPTIGAAKAMLGTAKQERKGAKTLETCFMILAVRLSHYIRMDEYKKSRKSLESRLLLYVFANYAFTRPT